MKYEIAKTELFDNWLKELRDRKGALAIAKRFTRVALGNFGDHRAVGGGVFELRFFIGPGYRVYYTIRRGEIVLLLAGGDKATQKSDIRQAMTMAKNLEE